MNPEPPPKQHILWPPKSLKASVKGTLEGALKGSLKGTLKGALKGALIVVARKLEHHHPHALKVKYKGS